MRNPIPDQLERGRVTRGEFASTREMGLFGLFRVSGPCGKELRIVASAAFGPDGKPVEDAQGWEHVSGSTPGRIPLWREMCFAKDLFWYPQDCCVQFHPPESDYVNNHARTLHIFRHITAEFLRPPAIMVGMAGAGELTAEQARGLRNIWLGS